LPSDNTEFVPLQELCDLENWDFSLLGFDQDDAAGNVINNASTAAVDHPVETEESPSHAVGEGMEVDPFHANLNSGVPSVDPPPQPQQQTTSEQPKTLPANNTCYFILQVVDQNQGLVEDVSVSGADVNSLINNATVDTPAPEPQQATVVESAPADVLFNLDDNINLVQPPAQTTRSPLASTAPAQLVPATVPSPTPSVPSSASSASPDPDPEAHLSDATKWRHRIKKKIAELESTIRTVEDDIKHLTEQSNMNFGFARCLHNMKGSPQQKRDFLYKTLLGELDYFRMVTIERDMDQHDFRLNKKVKKNPGDYFKKLEILLKHKQDLHTLKKKLNDAINAATQ